MMMSKLREHGDIGKFPKINFMLLRAIRDHRGIENSVHWVLDVVFHEDHSRVRKDHAPQNLAILRRIALNLLRKEKTAKGGIQAKRLLCAWNDQYFLKVMSL